MFEEIADVEANLLDPWTAKRKIDISLVNGLPCLSKLLCGMLDSRAPATSNLRKEFCTRSSQTSPYAWHVFLLVTRTLLGATRLTTRSKDATRAPGTMQGRC